MKPTKKPLIMSRIRKKLEQLKFNRFIEYIPLLENDVEGELEYCINALTTNETYFFRHTKQFNFFYEQLLPKLVEIKKENNSNRKCSCR